MMDQGSELERGAGSDAPRTALGSIPMCQGRASATTQATKSLPRSLGVAKPLGNRATNVRCYSNHRGFLEEHLATADVS